MALFITLDSSNLTWKIAMLIILFEYIIITFVNIRFREGSILFYLWYVLHPALFCKYLPFILFLLFTFLVHLHKLYILYYLESLAFFAVALIHICAKLHTRITLLFHRHTIPHMLRLIIYRNNYLPFFSPNSCFYIKDQVVYRLLSFCKIT